VAFEKEKYEEKKKTVMAVTVLAKIQTSNSSISTYSNTITPCNLLCALEGYEPWNVILLKVLTQMLPCLYSRKP
jgi:hypothetical protein